MSRPVRSSVSRRARGDRGVALVEFALIAPLLFSLMLGMFTGGLAYNQKLAIVNGAREGSRFGATLPVASPATLGCAAANQLDRWLCQVAEVTLQASEGHLAPGVTGRSLCVAYLSPSATAIDQTRKLTITGSESPSGGTFNTGGTCFSDGRPSSERRVQVSGSRPGSIEFVFGTMTPSLSSQSVTRFEAVVAP